MFEWTLHFSQSLQMFRLQGGCGTELEAAEVKWICSCREIQKVLHNLKFFFECVIQIMWQAMAVMVGHCRIGRDVQTISVPLIV